MRRVQRLLSDTRIYPFLIFVAVVSLVCALAPLSRASAGAVTITVVNNSQKEIRNLYLASANSDNWGDNQLSAAIAVGASRTINADWSESSVKVVAEDEDGCFLTTTLDAAGTPSWTITSDTPRDCGQNGLR
jgi:hypothetical protein